MKTRSKDLKKELNCFFNIYFALPHLLQPLLIQQPLNYFESHELHEWIWMDCNRNPDGNKLIDLPIAEFYKLCCKMIAIFIIKLLNLSQSTCYFNNLILFSIEFLIINPISFLIFIFLILFLFVLIIVIIMINIFIFVIIKLVYISLLFAVLLLFFIIWLLNLTTSQ